MFGENIKFLCPEERLAVRLKALYKSYGYKEYKLSSFDEYSLYADNQNFIGGREVISFSVGDKLLALRPDVTLSIAKNGRFGSGTEKLFYDEKVYRKSAHGGFSELSQIGVETIGDIDLACEAELCTLMLKTLACVGDEYVLDVSHMGVTVKAADGLGLAGEDRAYAFGCLASKNAHDFARFAAMRGLDGEKSEAFCSLITLPTDKKGLIRKLSEVGEVIDIAEEIAELNALTDYIGGDKINIDFSICEDAEYYNGLVFKGYVKGIPQAVLTGGRYDRLLRKFDKSHGAMGFALYLGELCKYIEYAPSQPDGVLVYAQNNALAALKAAERLRAEGKNILLSKRVPDGFGGKIYYAEDGNDKHSAS